MSRQWVQRLREFVPGFLIAHPALRSLRARVSVVLYGSTTQGVDDAFSDLDVWLLLPEQDVLAVNDAAGTRFFTFELDGKKGHFTAESVSHMERYIDRCAMDTIYHLRAAQVINDHSGIAGSLIAQAQLPMRQEVRDAFFFYHYVEMRSEHRACDNPIEREDAVALMLSLPKVISHALRAAMVLDGEPYPYDKWLYAAARQTLTGAAFASSVERILDFVADGHLRTGGPEDRHPIGMELRTIRQVLVEAARAKGSDAPWLDRWWLHMNAAQHAIKDIRWQ